ncbi:unnamed protein product [Clonostachys rosea f. rosea IK726]|uniref:Uncharacterized protein n=2 Tax=Bionectria ochroleuca TaxID=29856 RepID=A0A0B7JMN8_BIOOC|nr:unnamed protein product [Clonostachys rosea f. rosea IK726]
MTAAAHVAVIGAGPAGLAAIKSLLDEGFEVTCFEQRANPGGIWAFSEDATHTSVTSQTKAQLSKFLTPFSDFPHSDDVPRHPTGAHLGAYYRDYAIHYGLMDKIRFGTTVESIKRDESRKLWLVKISGEDTMRPFDKIIYAVGTETKAKLPTIEGQEQFQGRLIHGQAYKRPEEFAGMNVIVLGQGNSAADCAVELTGKASKVYFAHRRGALVIPRMVKGKRFDRFAMWKAVSTLFWAERFFPALHAWMINKNFTAAMRSSWGEIEPEFRFDWHPRYASNVTGVLMTDDLIPALRDGRVKSTWALRKIVGPKAVEMEDGTVLDDVDAIICCTGYSTPFGVFDETAIKFNEPDPKVPPQPNLYYNVISPEYPDSLAFLNFAVLFGSASQCRELASMAIAQIWRGKSSLPPREEMDRQIRERQSWYVKRCYTEPLVQLEGLVEPDSWLRWVHSTAGTGLYENLGWTWQGLRFSLRHPRTYLLLAYGVNTPHMLRYFETGKRKAWDGAMEAIRHANKMSRLDLSKKEEKQE